MNLALKIAIALFFFQNIAKAQHNHLSDDHNDVGYGSKESPPHGGQLKEIGKYNLEIVLDVTAPSEKMNFYILKSNQKTLQINGATGTIYLTYKDGTNADYELINNNIDKLYCDIKDVKMGFTALIKINYKNKEYHTTYFYKGMKK